MKVKSITIEKWFARKMNKYDFLAIHASIGAYLDGNAEDTGLEIVSETEKAICIECEWNRRMKKIWLPKSVISYTV